MPEGAVIEYEGRSYRREGECSHCGECCVGCPLRDHVARRCADYGGLVYQETGCATAPSDPGQLAAWPSCTFRFVEV